MARFVQTLANTQNKIGALDLIVPLVPSPSVLNTLIIGVVSDNDGSSGPIQPSGGGVSFWRCVAYTQIVPGTVTTGVKIAIWAGLVDQPNATTLTVGFGSTVVSKWVTVHEFSGVSSVAVVDNASLLVVRDVYGVQTLTGSNSSGGALAGNVAPYDLCLVLFALEGPFLASNTSPPSNFIQLAEGGTTGGNAQSNVSGQICYTVSGWNANIGSGGGTTFVNWAHCCASIRRSGEGVGIVT